MAPAVGSYAPTVTSLARERLTHARKPLADEDDVAVEVFKELFRGVQAGRFPQLTNRDELQHILADDLPIIPLYTRFLINAIRPDFCNFTPASAYFSELWNLEEFAYGTACP